ncbi:MAG: autotransporter outer membrane beta-barrel domain-containing protein [Pseudomonadota bacterium]
MEGGDPSTYILTNYTGETASPGRAIGLKGYRDTIPSSGASSTFSTTISINGVDHTITIADITKTDGAGVTPITFGAVTITGGAFGAAATIVNTGSQSASQVATGSNVMFQGASQNISTGIGNAIAERFFGGDGTQGAFSQDGSSLSAYVSVLGLGQAAQDRRAARLAMYDAPEALQAIEAATSGADAATADDGDEVSPYLLGMSDVPLAGAGPDVIRLNAWVRGTFTHYDGDAFSGDTWNGVAGVDYLATDDVLIGVMGGYERGDFDFDTTDGAFEGAGYTAGVYVGARLSDSIVADAFLTHSWLDYDTQAGTATGSTDASRWLVSLNVAGQYDIADGVTLEPNVRVFYAHETQDGYTLSDATVVAANSIDSGRLSLGPRLRFLVAEDWTASVSAHGEYDLSSEDQTDTTLPDFDGLLSARLGLGLDGTFANGWTLSLSGDVSGIGSGDFLAYTGTGKIRIPLY